MPVVSFDKSPEENSLEKITALLENTQVDIIFQSLQY